MAKKKVAVLGGGAGGLAAAFELTATKELRERYEVTVHQLGWRLGGKGASGRSAVLGERIEEHGLHIWFGFYENAFTMIQRCYDELGRPARAPLATWREAFEPCNEVVLLSQTKKGWHAREWRFPENDGVPGTPSPSDFWGIVRHGLRWLKDSRDGDAGPGQELDSALDLVLKGIDATTTGEVPPTEDLGVDNLLGIAAGIVGDLLGGGGGQPTGDEPAVRALVEGLEGMRDSLWAAEPGLSVAGVRDYAMVFDVVTAVIGGIVRDKLLSKGFARVNNIELREWLARHGARPETLEETPMLRAFYDLCFAYVDGDRARPNLAAGKALQALLRLTCTYQGAVMWKMRAGMGDAIFAPMYEVLAERGVRFEFFHYVKELGLSRDKERVARIEIVPQVEQPAGEYKPLVEVEGLPCWPSAPDWAQLADGDELRERGVDFEREPNPLRARALELEHGKDFDEVVLAIPVGALRPICRELADANPRFEGMLRGAKTVATQALQVWLRGARDELGWQHKTAGLAGANEPPLDTYCDMTHVLNRECWKEEDAVRAIAYFCGVMRDSDDTPEQADARARRDGLAHLQRHAEQLWPAAATNGGFDWSRLVDPEGREGEERFDAQYWRANVTPSDRYALTPAGSVERRLRPSESGFKNLALAGDWTRNGISGGSVEAAVTSGRLAARHISGEPAEVPGLTGWLEAD